MRYQKMAAFVVFVAGSITSVSAQDEPHSKPGDYRIIESRTGETTDLNTLADQLASHDAVFLGEEHNNTVGHDLHLDIIRALHARRNDIVITMEMFERDTQGILDDYLGGRIEEDVFREHARPWPNYENHYRPIIEFAKENQVDVLAANMPTRGPFRIKFTTFEDLVPGPYHAREFQAPRDAYWRLFEGAMKGHVGTDSAASVFRMYGAQCLKDETMAETMVDYLAGHPHRRPLLVHICGKFHSDYGYGTAHRFIRRRPLLSMGVVTMVSVEDPADADIEEHHQAGHYVLAVKTEAPRSVQGGSSEAKNEASK